MKSKLSIGFLLLCMTMAFGAICFTSCSNDDGPDDGYILGSEVYTFKYEEEYTYLREIISDPTSYGSDKEDNEGHISPDYPDYFSKSYRTSLGVNIMIMPKISVVAENESEIDQILRPFGDQLTYKNKIGRVFIYNCPVKNSDEVLKITTKLSKDKRVIGVDAFTDSMFELFDTDPLK